MGKQKIATKIDRMSELHGTDCACVECSECGGDSPQDAVYCMNCGALFVGDTIKGRPWYLGGRGIEK